MPFSVLSAGVEGLFSLRSHSLIFRLCQFTVPKTGTKDQAKCFERVNVLHRRILGSVKVLQNLIAVAASFQTDRDQVFQVLQCLHSELSKLAGRWFISFSD